MHNPYKLVQFPISHNPLLLSTYIPYCPHSSHSPHSPHSPNPHSPSSAFLLLSRILIALIRAHIFLYLHASFYICSNFRSVRDQWIILVLVQISQSYQKTELQSRPDINVLTISKADLVAR